MHKMANKIETRNSEKLAQALFTAGCIQFGEFVLKDGSPSPIYLTYVD